MDDTIHAQLSAWGKWIHNPIRRAVGYPSHAAGFGDYRPPGVEYKSHPPAGIFTGGDAMEDVDRAVQSLLPADRALCVEFYAIGPRWDAVCARLSVSKSALYNRLHRIQDLVSMRMRDGC